MRQPRIAYRFIPRVVGRSRLFRESLGLLRNWSGAVYSRPQKGRTNLTVGRIYSPLIAYETNANPRLLPPDDMTREIDVVGLDQ